MHYVQKKLGGMEVSRGDGVNPGYITKKVILVFPRVSPTNETNIKKLKTYNIKKTQHMQTFTYLGIRKIFSLTIGNRTLCNQTKEFETE